MNVMSNVKMGIWHHAIDSKSIVTSCISNVESNRKTGHLPGA